MDKLAPALEFARGSIFADHGFSNFYLIIIYIFTIQFDIFDYYNIIMEEEKKN